MPSTRFRLRRHGEEDSYYYVAVLNFVSSTESEYTYKLWVFDSMKGQWSSRLVSVHCPLYHLTSKVISLGEDGLLGFVDPWRGIIICDMIGQRSPKYLKVPPKLIRDEKVTDTGLLSRDIALVEGRLTIVDLCPATEPDINLNWNWQVSTWSRKVADHWEEDWHNDCNLCIPDIKVDKDTENVNFLPMLKDNEGIPRPTLGSLHIAHPILSLSDSHVVYVMAKVRYRDKKALVLSVDMRKSRLQGVAVFDAERMRGGAFDYTCTQSWIPKYFNPGVKENPVA
ncbi:hypothetical protein PR202_ga31582 [Eleusine coracana subsp. coracana]|uniref:DUF1618 domain-containing protein n=1 Tax=Eleusine coracana subsp. coracana TaxID=191504 RepID=A0AAV5DSH2_ELECO|nr:hypothetical protein PR202_ga31582 [Eleusine coracana subsp. coracana]